MPLNLTDRGPSGFARHGLEHTSASQINMWSDAPCRWVANYLFGCKGTFSPAAKCGLIVEDAVTAVISKGFTVDDAVAQAEKAYAVFTALGASDADRKRIEVIRPMTEAAVDFLKQYGTPEFNEDGSQKKIEVMCRGDGFSIPIIGYVDFVFPKHGKIIDLKTTSRMPSVLSDSHARQQAIYWKAFGNYGVDFLYVTGKKTSVLTNDNPAETLAQIKNILTRQERFLRVGDKDMLKSIVPVNAESFYWKDDGAILKEMYGF